MKGVSFTKQIVQSAKSKAFLLSRKTTCFTNICSQSHQHFTQAFFVQKCFAQLSLVTFQLCNFWRQNIGAICESKMLMKLTFKLNIQHIIWVVSIALVAFMPNSVGPTKKVPYISAPKMVLKICQKLTPIVNFILFLRVAFLHANIMPMFL
jgi:hypothetical protein